MPRTDLTSGTDTNNNSVYTTSSIAPAADNLILAFVLSANTGFGAAGVPSASGNGLTWDRVDTGNAGQFRLTCFRAMRVGAAPASGTVRFEFRDGAGALQNQDLCAWSIFEYGNVDLGGTNGSGAVAVHPQAVATGVTKLTAPLPLADQANVQVGGIILALQLAQAAHPVTPGVGFAEIHELSSNKASSENQQHCRRKTEQVGRHRSTGRDCLQKRRSARARGQSDGTDYSGDA